MGRIVPFDVMAAPTSFMGRIRVRGPVRRRAVLVAMLVAFGSACGSDSPAEGLPSPPPSEAVAGKDAGSGTHADADVTAGGETLTDAADVSPRTAEALAADASPAEEPAAEGEGSSGGPPEDPDFGDPATGEAPAWMAAVRFVSQNILHGAGCPAGSDSCRVTDRVALFMAQLAEAGCPELVSIQEANERIVGLVAGEAGTCGYEVVWDNDPGLDREVVLTTLDVIGSQRRLLADRFRSTYLVRVASPIGVIDFVTTHLASGDDRACNPELCPPPCDPGGSLRTCQARQVVEFAAEVAVDGAVTVVGGDLNDAARSPALSAFRDAGFADSHFASGHDECDPQSGAGCTAGREDESLADLTDPSSRQNSRIDYLLYSVATGRGCLVAEGTGLFNAEPASGELAFPSDHTGVALRLVCDEVHMLDRVDRTVLELPEKPAEPVPADSQPVDASTAGAITAAFETYLNGSISDVELRIDQVEDFDRMREAARETFERVGDSGAAARGRVDSISRTSSTTARVIYSILLNDQVIFDGRLGEAVLIDGRWFVSKATFCDLLALSPGAEMPGVC